MNDRRASLSRSLTILGEYRSLVALVQIGEPRERCIHETDYASLSNEFVSVAVYRMRAFVRNKGRISRQLIKTALLKFYVHRNEGERGAHVRKTRAFFWAKVNIHSRLAKRGL